MLRQLEPWVYCNAMTTHTATGLEDVHPRVVICKLYQLANIDIEVFTHERQLVSKCDVYIAKAVLSELN